MLKNGIAECIFYEHEHEIAFAKLWVMQINCDWFVRLG